MIDLILIIVLCVGGYIIIRKIDLDLLFPIDLGSRFPIEKKDMPDLRMVYTFPTTIEPDYLRPRS